MIKLFDLNEQKNPPFIEGSPRELAWPCKLFRVTMPKSKHNSRRINAFELCILKLLAYGRYEPKDLAKATCLPHDLIKVVLLRLYDTGKIDKYYQVSPETLKDIEKYDEERESEPSEYETWAIFQECVTGKLLPMLVDAKLQAAEINEEGKLVVKGSQPKRLTPLSPVINDADAPTTSEVLSAIQTMKRRGKMLEESYSVPSIGPVSIVPDSEQCKLRVRMVIQKNSGDWRILNPFGKGWSLELESAYSTLLKNKKEEENFKNWMERNTKRNQQKKEEDNLIKEPYDTQDNWDRYPELIRTLKRGKKTKNGIQRGIDVYAALEWALFYALKNCESTRNRLQLIQFNSNEENEKSLHGAINNLVINKQYRIPLSMPYAKRFQEFDVYDSAEMKIVLPLAFLVANDDSQFAFNRVLKIFPDFFLHFNAIKESRNKYMHGNSKFSQPYGPDNYIFMEDVISTLIPSVCFSDTPPELIDPDDIFDDRLNARIALQDFLGVSLFNQMDSILQRELMNVEIFRSKKGKDSFDALPCINYLYSAAQCAFRPLLGSDDKGSNPVSAAQQKAIDENPISFAQQKAMDAGWGELPKSLQKIRPDLLHHTMEGNDGSLGASVVVWLIRTDIAELSNIASKLPGFIKDIDNLLSLRNHGNKSVVIHKEELNNCIENIYKIIRTIMEA